jgi:hypothetical protein
MEKTSKRNPEIFRDFADNNVILLKNDGRILNNTCHHQSSYHNHKEKNAS